LTCERVPLPASVELIVIDSGISHHHASGEYRVRREECARAAAALGVNELRDVGADSLAGASALPPPLNRRVRHVVTENDRVLETVRAFRAGDVETAGRLFDASHASMRDDYQVSISEIDRLVEIARREPNVFGARLTGGGFGGSIVALVRAGHASAAGWAIVKKARREIGEQVTLLVPM
jgi:galactokinase